ncbi:MAG: biotin--[acetyl-CoA-carboxylase] ligase [Thermodesulfobacteriota bacterium]
MNIIDKNKLIEHIESDLIGNEVIVLDSVSSTNTKMSELVSNNINEGTVLISDKQTGGKGRMGREWFSPPGCNIYMSVLFEPEILPDFSPVFTFIASLAIVETLKHFDFKPEIKWPNDVLLSQKKVSGVLTEMKSTGKRLDFIIVGMGLKCKYDKKYY